MSSEEIEKVEERLRSFLAQLKTEHGVLDRIVYKNKNQHRRASYFQYMLKVRRDVRLLQSANLEEILNNSIDVIHGKRPKHKVQLLESLKRRKCDNGKHNFLERLLGAARLLSEMVEPMLRAAMEISTLLAQSFFMGFSLTVLSILARLRVLVQQMLLDVVHIFNVVSSLSQKEQTVKLTQDRFEVFREYYPTKQQAVSLDCTWQTDKYVLVERLHRTDIESNENDIEADVSLGAPKIEYQSIKAVLGDSDSGKKTPDHELQHNEVHVSNGNEAIVLMDIGPENPRSSGDATVVDISGESDKKDDLNRDSEGRATDIEKTDTSALSPPALEEPSGNESIHIGEASTIARPGSSAAVGDINVSPSDSLFRDPAKYLDSGLRSGSSRVAFVSVKAPALPLKNQLVSKLEGIEAKGDDKEDTFFNLLGSENVNSSLF